MQGLFSQTSPRKAGKGNNLHCTRKAALAKDCRGAMLREQACKPFPSCPAKPDNCGKAGETSRAERFSKKDVASGSIVADSHGVRARTAAQILRQQWREARSGSSTAGFFVSTGNPSANPPCRVNTGFTGIATGGLRGYGSQKRGTGNGRRVVGQNEFRTVGQKQNDLEFSEPGNRI